jgi:hypothetical protein
MTYKNKFQERQAKRARKEALRRELLGAADCKHRTISIRITDQHTWASWVLCKDLEAYYRKTRKLRQRRHEWLRQMFHQRTRTMKRWLDKNRPGWRDEFGLPVKPGGRGNLDAFEYCWSNKYLPDPRENPMGNQHTPALVERWGPGRES